MGEARRKTRAYGAHATVTWGRSGARELRRGLQTRAAFKTLDFKNATQGNFFNSL